MYEFYCPKCDRKCDPHEEIELEEFYEGDYVEVHTLCRGRVNKSLIITKRESI